MRALLRDHLRIFEKHGVDIVSTACPKGGHYKFTVEYNGEQRLFIGPTSGSDHRGLTNFEAEVKRWKRNITERTLP